jgi:biopolymer transport protein ExbB
MTDFFVKGGPIMYPLLVCSIISMTVVIERLIFWIREDMNRNRTLVNEVLELSRVGDWEAVRLKSAGSKDFVIRVLVTGILHREFSMTKAMETKSADEIKRMRRYLGIIDTMITVAPLFGILGTVLGIISSFHVLGSIAIEHPQAVTAGIAEALITTAAGLGIAIFSVFPYNYFSSRVENAVLSIEKAATSLEIVYEKLIQDNKERKEHSLEG